MVIKNSIKLAFVATLVVLCCYAAENFLAEPVKSRTTNQMRHRLKQEVLELAGTIVKQQSKCIELTAKTQQQLFTCIEQGAYSEKNCFIARASRQELHQVRDKLKEITAAYEKELQRLVQIESIAYSIAHVTVPESTKKSEATNAKLASGKQ